MKIGVDYRLARLNPNSGMGVYVSQMIANLSKIDGKNRYFLLKDNNSHPTRLLGKFMGLFRELSWVNLGIGRAVSNNGIDLLYSPNPPLPMFSSIPIILTIPDLSFFRDKTTNPLLKIYLYIIYFLSAQRAKFITTFSLNSKCDISRVLMIPVKKISIIPPAIKNTFVKKKPRKETLKKYGINKKYIISVPGTFIPRKNVADLVAVFSSLPEKVKKNLCLVLVGNKKDAHFKTFYESLKDKKDLNKIIFTDYVSEKELVELYSGAEIFISTSLYEGFGLPPLEAMACGTPAITYRNSSLTEVVEGAGILVGGKRQLRDAILKILRESPLRQKLIKLGHLRAKTFLWTHSAQKLLDIIEKVRNE